MPVLRGPRVLLLSAAAALAAGTGGAALAAGGGDTQASARTADAVDFPALRTGQTRWSFSTGDDDVIQVRGRKCPKGHPHKVGSSSYHSATRINDGKLETRSSARSLCAK